MESAGKLRQTYLVVIAMVAWLGVALQIFLSVTHYNTERSLVFRLVDAISYFTVLTNILIAVVGTASAWRRSADTFLTRPSTMSASAIYIFVVGVIYALLLKDLWEPTGLQLAADVALHTLVPILYVLYWLLFVSKGTLQWIQPVYWLIYPLAYIVYSLVRGALIGRYHYHFADVTALGYPTALFNAAMMLIDFFVLGLIVVAIDHLMGRFRSREGMQASK